MFLFREYIWRFMFVATCLLGNIGQSFSQTTRRPASHDADPLHVYPNPSTGKFTVDIKAQEQLFDINIYNLMGEMVFHWESAGTGAATLEVDLSRRPDGLYFVELDTEKANVLRRIVLERQQ